ncbi:MAG: hypothetical protein ACOY33_13460 [Pseudomonadota bacterium]
MSSRAMSRHARQFLKPVAVLAATFALSGCLGNMVLQDVTDATLAAGSTILVGKVRLEPPLAKDEQYFAGNVVGEGRLVNSVVLLTSTEEVSRPPEQPRIRDLQDSINAKFDQTFFLKAAQQPFNITGGMVSLEISNRADYAYLPGRLQVPIRNGDKAVYIGTLVFHRDDFFEITRVEIRDEFAAAEREYKKQVRGAPPLRKALLKKIPR